MADSFVLPDLDAPLDLEARLAQVPAAASLKGMFLQSVADEARAASGVTAGRGRWVAFKDYPISEFLKLLVECGKLTHPRASPREGIRRLGARAYPTFAESTVGRVIMSVAGSNFDLALRQAPRIYAVSGNTTTAQVTRVGDGHAIVHLRSAWDFPESWQVGVFEGAMRIFRRTGTVRVRTLSICDVDLELTWQ